MNHDRGNLKIDRSNKTLRELTLETLREAILDSRFRPGERLVERTLCDLTGVSRTVVREVLRHLESEGLVETLPHHGPIVARPNPAQAAQIYEIRELLETGAASACAANATKEDIARLSAAVDAIEAAFAGGAPHGVLRATSEFYEKMFRIAEKTVAWGVVQSINVRINHLRALTISTPGRATASIAEMRRLVEAIGKNDRTAAFDASRDHIRTVSNLARQTLESQKAASS